MRRLALAATAAALLLAACADDEAAAPPTTASPATTREEPASTSTESPATTEDAAATTQAPARTTDSPATTEAAPTTSPVEDSAAFAEAGPFPVGVTTLALPSGPAVEVWYPAADGTTGTVAYDVRDFTPPAVRDLLTGDVPASYEYPAGRDAEVADGTFPVVLFSHGFTGIRVQSSFLTSHLASWGMIVAAPDHPSRDLFNVLGGTASGDRESSVTELLATLDLVTAASVTAGDRFEGHVDTENVAALGHSAGGGTVLGAAADERVDGYVSMASGGPEDAAGYPDTPSFFLAGALDAVVEPARTRASFELAPTPTLLWVIDDVGHNGFDDFCTFGGGTGIIGVAEASGLGGLLDAQPQLRALGEDGCVPPAAPVDQAFPIIRHAVTAWLSDLFVLDPESPAAGPGSGEGFDLGVVVTERR